MKRRLAREIALQSLYQMQINHMSSAEAIHNVVEEAENDNESNLEISGDTISPQYIMELVEGTNERRVQIDELLVQYLKGWKMDRLSRIDREILRLAVYEMIYREDIPPKVVVNEAIDLAKHFGSEDSGKFVNGVLGKLIKEVDRVRLQSQVKQT